MNEAPQFRGPLVLLAFGKKNSCLESSQLASKSAGVIINSNADISIVQCDG